MGPHPLIDVLFPKNKAYNLVRTTAARSSSHEHDASSLQGAILDPAEPHAILVGKNHVESLRTTL